MKKLSRTSERVYGDLKDTLKRQIELGELVQGQAVMAERKLANYFAISRESVRRGLRELVEEGYLKMVPAKGVFVDYRAPIRKTGVNTSTLGYVFWGAADSVIQTPFFEGLIKGVAQETQAHGFHFMVTALPVTDPRGLPSMVQDKKVDGVLLEGAPLETYRRIEQEVPVVVISNYLRSPKGEVEYSGDMVSADNMRAMINLFSYIYNLGHRKIGFLSPTLEHSSFYERYEGYRLGLHKHGLPFREDYVVFTPMTPSLDSVKAALKIKDRPTAFICANDFIAMELMEVAEESGISIPEELSITGFDDVEGASLCKPPLTTVRVSTVEMGRLAVRRLIEKVGCTDHDEILTLVPGEIIPRKSCVPPQPGN